MSEESWMLLCIAHWQQVQPSALHHIESRVWSCLYSTTVSVLCEKYTPSLLKARVAVLISVKDQLLSTDAGGADLDPHSKTYLEPLLTILCWINDSSEAEWSIPFVVKSFHFYLVLGWRWHWLILVDVPANFRISDCNSSPFFLTKWLESHYITKVIAIVVFSRQRLKRQKMKHYFL